MLDYIEKLESDLIEQFRGKPHICAIVETVGEQLNELAEFFEDLQSKRSVNSSEGVQLDGIGDIVVLTRKEAEELIKGQSTLSSNLDDETYRQRILFKILKNTSNCKYTEVRKAIDMLWSGPKLKYVEDDSHPASLVFEFDASPELTEKDMNIPFIRAGGVGLVMKMLKEDNLSMYYGLPYQKSTSRLIDCEVAIL